MGLFDFLKRDKPQKRMAIIDVGDDNFKQQVIQRSYKMPVLVDFWAAWCGPCRQLGPVLERIAEDPESDFILAKLDTERHQRTAQQFNIYSIPHVKAFRNGQVVEEFTGAIPETLVRRFVKKVSDTTPPPPAIKLSNNPTRRLKQAEQHLLKGRGFQAFVALSDFPEGSEAERAAELQPLARFMVDMADGDGITGLEALDEAYIEAARALERRKPKDALNHLVKAVEKGEQIDAAHTESIIASLLSLLGDDHPVAQVYRSELAVAEDSEA